MVFKTFLNRSQLKNTLSSRAVVRNFEISKLKPRCRNYASETDMTNALMDIFERAFHRVTFTGGKFFQAGFIAILLLFPYCSQAWQTQKRLALIIGNSNYWYGGQLNNPVNDALAMDSTLTKLGFRTLLYQNLDQKSFKKAIDDFGKQLTQYEVGLFYYAGHGIQSNGSNYLIPVDADLKNEQQIEYDCISADRVLTFMEAAKTKVNLLLLDACRNNPFERSWSRSITGNGLAFMNAPAGSFISYATSPGRVASDGSGKNGLFTGQLLRHLSKPGISIEQVFKLARIDIVEISKGEQVPWESTSLRGEFYFNQSVPVDSVTMQEPHLVPAVSNPFKRHRLKAIVEVPIQVGIGYELFLSRRLSVTTEIGVLTEPNSSIILSTLQTLGTAEDVVLMIKNAFQKGIVFKSAFQYNFGRNYIGAYLQSFSLFGNDTAYDLVEAALGVDLSSYPTRPGRANMQESSLILRSNLKQAGVLYGRRVPLKNNQTELGFEISVSKNVASQSELESANRELGAVSQIADVYLNEIYSKYAYLPGVAFKVAHRFK
jgi:hypothetical protein